MNRGGCSRWMRRLEKKKRKEKEGNDDEQRCRRAYASRTGNQRESALHIVAGTVENSRFTQCKRSFALFRGLQETSNVLKRFTTGLYKLQPR